MSAVDAWVCFAAVLFLLLAYWDTRLLHAREEAGRERDRAGRAARANASLYLELDALHRELELGARTDPVFARIVAQIERESADREAGAIGLDDHRANGDLGGAA